MGHRGACTGLGLILLGVTGELLLNSTVQAAPSPKTTEIKVSLFGQPCTLQGPLDEATLKLVHSVSPEQLYPVYSPTELPKASGDRARASLKKIQGGAKLPSVLDRYRERLTKRLEAQIAFFDAASILRKSKKAGPVVAAAEKHFLVKNIKTFETAAKKLESAKKPDTEALFDLFNDGIEQDPQEEFHRAVRKLNISYVCAFEESTAGAGDDEVEAE